jgi:penicillin-binding protein-related factor A (putative recombinase)
MHANTEASFKIKVRTKLDSLGPECFYFVKEAMALRGLADIYGCYKGVFFAWELKKAEKELKVWRDGHELQKYNLDRVTTAQGVARFVYPENFDECFKELKTAGDLAELFRNEISPSK